MIPTKTAAVQAGDDVSMFFAQLNGLCKNAQSCIANGASANAQRNTPAVAPSDYTAAFTPAGVETVNVIAAALSQTDASKLANALAALQ